MNLDLTLNISQTQVIPVTAEHTRREFLTAIEGEPGNYLAVIDNTALEKVVRCPTAGRNYLILGREPHAKNAALSFGGAIHDGVETFKKGGNGQAQSEAIVQYFMDNPTPPDEYRTPMHAVKIMEHYCEQSRIREDYKEQVLEDTNGPLIERPFEIPLGVLEINEHIEPYGMIKQIHVAWSGRIDRVTRAGERNRVVDVKTTSIKGDQFIQNFQLSTQTIGYVWAAQQMWPDLNILGFCLDAIFFKKPTGSGGLMEKGPRGGEPSLEFFRATFDYTQQRIDQWAANTLTIIEDFVHSFKRNFFPMHTFHCFNKYGKCPYHDVCTIDDPLVRDRMLQSDAYKSVTWDPTIGR
jgi:PD-(D/E)XK nuclease superfamily